MQTLVISKDQFLINTFSTESSASFTDTTIFNDSSDPLDIISLVHSLTPNLLIFDDDLLQPNSSKILKSIKQISKNVRIIFLTSDNSIDLGREISPMGVYFYGIKPISQQELLNLINSVSANNKSITYS